MYREWAVSQIMPCADVQDYVAKGWFFSMVESSMASGDKLVNLDWLYEKYEWGPSRWPYRWKDLIEAKTLDCGVFADLVQLAFEHAGIECARIQWIERASESQTAYWSKLWEDAGLDSSGWIIDSTHVYHELVGFNANGVSGLYDSTEGRLALPVPPTPLVEWIKQCDCLSRELRWNKVDLVPGKWCHIDSVLYENQIIGQRKRYSMLVLD